MNEVQLSEGVAEYMGDGIFVLCQPSDQGPQSVAVSLDDLERLRAAVED